MSLAFTAGFDISPNWDFSVGVGSAVRTVDASQRFSDHLPTTKAQTSAEFMGNPSLEPERSTQADIRLAGSWSRASAQRNDFGRWVGNYITQTLTDEAKHLPLPVFPPEVYAYVKGEATEPAFGISPLTGSAGLRYEDRDGRNCVEGKTTIVAEQVRIAASRGESPTDGHTVLDLRAGIAPIRGVSLRFGVENVLDESYVNHLNSRNVYIMEDMMLSPKPIPEPGRVLFIDASDSF